MYWLAKLCGGWAILWRGRVGGVLSALVVLYCLCWNATSKMIRVVVWCCECGVVVAALAGAPLCLDVESLLCRGIRNVGRLCVLPSAALLDSLSGVAGGWGGVWQSGRGRLLDWVVWWSRSAGATFVSEFAVGCVIHEVPV